MTTNHENKVCIECGRNTNHNGQSLRLTTYEIYFHEKYEEVLLCLFCADHIGYLERQTVFRIMGFSHEHERKSIEFNELVKLCANILPFDIERIKQDEQDEQDNEKITKLSVAKYLQFMLQFYRIYLDIGLIKADIGYNMYLNLYPIPNIIVFDDDRYYQRWNPLVTWTGAEGFKYKTDENPFYSHYCFEYKGVNLYISPGYFKEEPYCDYASGCSCLDTINPLDTLKEYANKDDILIKK